MALKKTIVDNFPDRIPKHLMNWMIDKILEYNKPEILSWQFIDKIYKKERYISIRHGKLTDHIMDLIEHNPTISINTEYVFPVINNDIVRFRTFHDIIYNIKPTCIIKIGYCKFNSDIFTKEYPLPVCLFTIPFMPLMQIDNFNNYKEITCNTGVLQLELHSEMIEIYGHPNITWTTFSKLHAYYN